MPTVIYYLFIYFIYLFIYLATEQWGYTYKW